MPISLSSNRLDLDEATRLYFPDSSHQGEAQFRFLFRLQDGQEEWLFARLTRTDESVFTMGSSPDRRSLYCIILRPENAEAERVFVCSIPHSRISRLKLFLTQEEAEQFEWELFPPFLLDRGEEFHYAKLWRYWSVDTQGCTYLFRFNSAGVGETREIPKEFMGCGYAPEQQEEFFRWTKEKVESPDESRLRFLREETSVFHEQLESAWNDPNSEMRYAIHWQTLSEPKKKSFAFKCQNGEWSELKRLAVSALQMCLVNDKDLPDRPQVDWFYSWNFTETRNRPWISIDGNLGRYRPFEKGNKECLDLWRTVLTRAFRPQFIDENGVLNNLPLCLENYITSEKNNFAVRLPSDHYDSQHEVVEAPLHLREWVLSHCSPEEAERLLSL